MLAVVGGGGRSYIPNLFLMVTLCRENLSSGENRAEGSQWGLQGGGAVPG